MPKVPSIGFWWNGLSKFETTINNATIYIPMHTEIKLHIQIYKLDVKTENTQPEPKKAQLHEQVVILSQMLYIDDDVKNSILVYCGQFIYVAFTFRQQMKKKIAFFLCKSIVWSYFFKRFRILIYDIYLFSLCSDFIKTCSSRFDNKKKLYLNWAIWFVVRNPSFFSPSPHFKFILTQRYNFFDIFFHTFNSINNFKQGWSFVNCSLYFSLIFETRLHSFDFFHNFMKILNIYASNIWYNYLT